MNQLRRHLKYTWAHRLRYLKWKRRAKSLGKGVFIERNTQLMRYPLNAAIGDHVVVKEGVKICPCNEAATISIGHNTTIGYYTMIFASNSIEIGDDCQIAPFVYIVDSDHGTARDQKMNAQANQTAPISIGNDVWIGTGAKILKGVTVGHGAVIAAGALVRDDVEEYAIVGGMPAKQLSVRQ